MGEVGYGVWVRWGVGEIGCDVWCGVWMKWVREMGCDVWCGV